MYESVDIQRQFVVKKLFKPRNVYDAAAKHNLNQLQVIVVSETDLDNNTSVRTNEKTVLDARQSLIHMMFTLIEIQQFQWTYQRSVL